MPIVVCCPSCSRRLRVPDELLGKKVKCPTCGENFTAAAAGPEMPPTSTKDTPTEAYPPPAREPGSGNSGQSLEDATYPSDPSPREEAGPVTESRKPPSRRSSAEQGDDEDDDDLPIRRSSRRRDAEPHRGGMILSLGIISLVLGVMGDTCGFCCFPFALGSLIALPLGIMAWVMGQGDLVKMREGKMDETGQGSTKGGSICGIIGTILGGLGILMAVAMILLNLTGALTSNWNRPSFSPPSVAPPRQPGGPGFSSPGGWPHLQDYLPRPDR